MRADHVFAREQTREGWERAPLLECGGDRRLPSGRVVQRRVLHLGEINDSRQVAWR